LSSFNIAVLISGNGSNLQAVIDAVNDGHISNAEVRLVISTSKEAFGLERAKKNGIPNMVIDRRDTVKLLETLENYETEGIVLAGYLAILPPDIVKAYSKKIINIHPALLPMFGGKGFYGLKVHQAVIASGVKYSGATAHIVDSGVDTGAALVRSVVPVLPEDTAESLQKRVLKAEHIILVQAVKAMVENRIEDMIKKPVVLIDAKDREGVFEYAEDLIELGRAIAGEEKTV